MDSKKNLLNEATIRRFMKLAELAPLASPFIESTDTLQESTEETVVEVVTEDEEDPTPEEAEYDAAYEDEGFEAGEEAGEEAAEDADLGLEDELEDAGTEAGMEEKVRDFLEDVAAAATKHLGVATEVETDAGEVEDVEAMDIDAEQDMELDIADMDDTEVVDVDDVELEEATEEEAVTEEKDPEWGEGEHEYKRRSKDGVKHKAGDVDHHYKDYEVKWGGNKGEKSKTHKGEEDYTTKKGMKKKTGPGKAYMQEDNDRIAEEITRRVVERLLNTKD
jgi:hypothetical protein